MRILYIPLDERPCNYKYPQQIVKKSKEIELIIPPLNILNNKKSPADVDKLWDFVEDNIEECDYAVLSLDMLIYGGLLPSRLHIEKFEKLKDRLDRVKKLKEINPKVKIYGFDLIMRVPAYDSSEEEPDYYAEFGETIFRVSWLEDKLRRGEATEEDEKLLEECLDKLPKEYYDDYFDRRLKNFEITQQVLTLVKEGIFDEFVIPQDDSALYGIQSEEQQLHRGLIKVLNIENKVLIYPGADEVGCTLVARAINDFNNSCPKVYIRFASVLGPTIIPKYEDRPLLETIKAHVISCGMNVTDNSIDADLILMVNCPGTEMIESWEQGDKGRTYHSHRNLHEFVIAIREYIKSGKKVIISDSAYSNGSDLQLITLLKEYGVLDKITSYAGWNTNGNTLGTVLSSGVASLYGEQDLEFLIYRLIEDCGYQALVRQKVIDKLPEQGLSYYDFKDKTNWVKETTKELLNDFINEKLDAAFDKREINIKEVSFPWKRMFEIDLDLEVK